MVHRLCVLLLTGIVLLSSPVGGEEVYLVPIKGTIEKGLAAFVSRVIRDAEIQGVEAVVFDIDTPGGALDAALNIRDAVLYSEVKTIAFVNPRAISAGALISLAMTHIVMVEGGTIGAATAVDMQGNKASEKVISYFRNEMKATAEKTGRSAKLAEAMVDEDVDVPHLAPKGKLLTLTTEEAVVQKVAEYKVKSIDEGERLQELLKFFSLEGARILPQSVNWAEQAVRWLTYPYVASLLMTLGFLGLIFEIQSPGWGVGGTVGLICLGLFFGSHLLVNLADWSDLLLFLVGVTLVLIDLFFVVGFGALGIPGIALIFSSFFLSLMGRTELWTWDSAGSAATPLLLAIIFTIGIAFFAFKSIPSTTTWNRLVLQAEEKATEGYLAVSEYTSLLGKEGIAYTPLRPGGTVFINGRRLSVTSEGDFIDKDTLIKVVEVEGNRIVVRKILS